MSSGHEDPESADTASRADLVLIQSKILLGLAEKDLNRPTNQIRIQNLLGSEMGIRAEKGAQSPRNTKGILGKGNEDNSIFQIVEIAHVTIHIILPLANGNEADIRISFMDKWGELGNLASDTGRKDDAISFERTNGIEAFDQKGIHYFNAAIPTITRSEERRVGKECRL